MANCYGYLANLAGMGYNEFYTGRSAARLAHLNGVQVVGGSNPLAPTFGDR